MNFKFHTSAKFSRSMLRAFATNLFFGAGDVKIWFGEFYNGSSWGHIHESEAG